MVTYGGGKETFPFIIPADPKIYTVTLFTYNCLSLVFFLGLLLLFTIVIVDEVNALVLDIGTCNVRAGYAGEDTPKAMFPTSVGYIPKATTNDTQEDATMTEASAPTDKYSQYYIGDNRINSIRKGMDIINPMEDGLSKLHRPLMTPSHSHVNC
jgi:hypothetical protein